METILTIIIKLNVHRIQLINHKMNYFILLVGQNGRHGVNAQNQYTFFNK